MAIFGGGPVSSPYQDVEVLMAGPKLCENHGIPDMPYQASEFGLAASSSAVFLCGGLDASSTGIKYIIFITLV